MPSFPKLKSGAVMQYPAGGTVAFRNEVLRFLDGSEQRYRDGEAPLRRWTVRLDLLDQSELAELEHFFAENAGAYGTFEFTDPLDGKEYARCSLNEDAFEAEIRDELRGRATLEIREERVG